MKVVGLLSGGKDSCYNLVHCVVNGHEPVVVASLSPPAGQEEMDSYMYQTVGQDAIEMVAAALDLPLIRRVITGTALEQGSEYGDRRTMATLSGDETEDMYQLLSTVKEQYPDVEGVSVGAILSNYQRVRVEHVCRRLGLTAIAYLWQRDQKELLSEMIDAGLEAVLIKVAGIGLTDRHLGKSLREMEPTLTKLNILYGAHICGEGGEYETLTLDCPIFKSRIVLSEVEPVVTSSDGVGMVAYLRVKQASLVPKPTTSNAQCTVPPMLDHKYSEIEKVVEQLLPGSLTTGAVIRSSITHPIASSCPSRRIGNWVSVSGAEANSLGDVESETKACFELISDELNKHDLDLTHISHINVLISSMDLFTLVNAVFASTFGTSPPTRACVAADLPDGCRVRMDCVAHALLSPSGSGRRQALHVQGVSYWAPANIGPYSQSILVGNEIFVSGQIGLIPGRMQMPSPPSLALESALAYQHVDRILACIKTGSGESWPGILQCALIWIAEKEYLAGARSAWEAYRTSSKAGHASALFVACSSIPKGGLAEVQMLHHTGRMQVLDTETEMMENEEVVLAAEKSLDEEGAQWRSVRTADITLTILTFRNGGPLPKFPLELIDSTLSARLFHTGDFCATPIFASIAKLFLNVPVALVPSRMVATEDAEWDGALLLFGVTQDDAQR